MFNVYPWAMSWKAEERKGRSVVCSSPSRDTTVARKNGEPLYQTLHYEMNRIFNFLKSHPQAIITVWFDDFANASSIVKDMREIVSKNTYDPILKPSDWPAAQQKGTWPTLGWMRQHNKRLLLFTNNYDKHTHFTWPMKHYFWENIYGSVDPNVTCSEEKETKVELHKGNRSLVSFGCYGAATGATTVSKARDPFVCFEYGIAKDLTKNCQKRNFARGNLFNVYWVDHLIKTTNDLAKEHKRTMFDYVNELNEDEAKKK